MMNQLEQLKTVTTVVADTGDFKLLSQFQPQDATTNPSLVLKTVQKPEYQHLLADTIAAHPSASVAQIMDRLLVRLGCEILSLIPGRVSTEVDARLSFDTEATAAKAREIVALYAEAGIGKERLLIKIASTWEGIQAAKTLEQEGIRTNLTLLFSLTQAVACAEAKVQLISPFVGRIYDWFKKQAGADWDEAAHAGVNDPGVQSVREIYQYYKYFGIATEVMGASFRNVGQITALAGCDLLTISPDLLAELQNQTGTLERQLEPHAAKALSLQALHYDEHGFKATLRQDAMASGKLAEGIAAFEADTLKLEQLIEQHRAA